MTDKKEDEEEEDEEYELVQERVSSVSGPWNVQLPGDRRLSPPPIGRRSATAGQSQPAGAAAGQLQLAEATADQSADSWRVVEGAAA